MKQFIQDMKTTINKRLQLLPNAKSHGFKKTKKERNGFHLKHRKK
jgi:hypothetical protein